MSDDKGQKEVQEKKPRRRRHTQRDGRLKFPMNYIVQNGTRYGLGRLQTEAGDVISVSMMTEETRGLCSTDDDATNWLASNGCARENIVKLLDPGKGDV